tara:strand:+ start:179 stop:415 length:237 start_codon:yes stop_codon:yes gene_type:complete
MRIEEAAEIVEKAQQEGPSREDMEALYGEVWDTAELQQDFHVKSFFAPLVIVERKSDGQRGTLDFIHHPRFYYNFRAH